MSAIMPSVFGSDNSFKANLTQNVEFSCYLPCASTRVSLQKVAIVSDKICCLWKFQHPPIATPSEGSFSRSISVCIPDNAKTPLAVQHYAVGNFKKTSSIIDVESIAEFDKAILKV